MAFDPHPLFGQACALDDGLVDALLSVDDPASLIRELKTKFPDGFDQRSLAVYTLEQSAAVIEKLAAREQTQKASGQVISLMRSKTGFIGSYARAEGSLAFFRAYCGDNGKLLVVHSDEPKEWAAMNKALLTQYSQLDAMAAAGNHDPLTNLLNRRGAEDKFARIVKSAAYNHSARKGDGGLPSYGFYLTLDLDKFKNINDTYGHEGGDTLLKLIGETLEKALRPEDMVCRLGGDEFAASGLCEDPEGASATAKRILEVFKAKTFRIGTNDVSIGMSVGVIAFRLDDPGVSLSALNDIADKGLYEAKKTGRGKVVDMGVFLPRRESSAPNHPVDNLSPSQVCKQSTL